MGPAALVVVLSAGTTSMVAALARSGWSGPVLVVGSVAEARQVLGAGATTASGPVRVAPPPVAQPAPVTLQPVRSAPVGPGPLRPGTSTVDLGVCLDEDRQMVVTDDGDCGLTPLEFGVLEALAHEPGRAWRFEELTRRVWGTDDIGDWAPVHAVVRRLRRKLQDVHASVEIVAVRGIGFRLERPAEVAAGKRPAEGVEGERPADVALERPANCPDCA